MRVTFIGESGVDTGGPGREFFSLLFEEACDHLMSHGQKPNSCYFNHDQISNQERQFYYFGKLAAVAILGGMGAPKNILPFTHRFHLKFVKS